MPRFGDFLPLWFRNRSLDPANWIFSGAAFIRREVACRGTDLYKGKAVHDIREVSERLYFLIRFNVPKWNSKLYVRRKSFSGSGALPPTFPPKLSKLPCVIFPIAPLALSCLPSISLFISLLPCRLSILVFSFFKRGLRRNASRTDAECITMLYAKRVLLFRALPRPSSYNDIFRGISGKLPP